MYIVKTKARKLRINWVRVVTLVVILVLLIKIGLLASELSILRGQLDEAQVKVTEVQQSFDFYKSEVSGLVDENKTLEQENSDLKAEISSMAQKLKDKQVYDSYVIDILSIIIYAEAGNQSELGKYAVALVVRNRVESNKFPNTYEDVIYQKNQFCGASHPNFDTVIPEDCIKIATEVYNGTEKVDFPLSVYYFKTVDCNADWSYKVYKTIGDHTFYYG